MVGLHYFSLLFSLLTKYILFIFSPPFSIYFVFNSAKHTLNSYENIRGCLVFFFITHYSSLNFHHLTLITYHLKYPNFLYPSVWHTSLNFSSLNFSTFLWDPRLSTMSSHSQPTRVTYIHFSPSAHIFFPFIFPLLPTYSPRTLNKPSEAVGTIIIVQLSCCFFFMPSFVMWASFCHTERV